MATLDPIVIPELEEIARNYEPRQRPWGEDEDAVLRKYYNRVPIESLVKYFKRTQCSIQSHANVIGITNKKGSEK